MTYAPVAPTTRSAVTMNAETVAGWVFFMPAEHHTPIDPTPNAVTIRIA